MRRIILSVAMLALVAALASAGTVHADDEPGSQDLVIGLPPPCGDETAATLSAVDCAGVEPVDSLGPIAPEIEAAAAETARVETALVASQGPEALRRNCRFHAEVSLYTDSDWNRLAQNLAAQASHCADYYISIPALTANKTMPRPDQAWRIRALGPRFHAMAEAHLTAWQTWVITNGRTWTEAGQEFRRRMAAAGYDVAGGDLWAMNEVPSQVRQNAGQARRNLLDFLRGLYEGDASTGTAKGLVFVVGLGQRTQNLSVYLGNMRGWLSDAPFWVEADAYVRFWAQETYGDVRAWGVADAPAHDPGAASDRVRDASVEPRPRRRRADGGSRGVLPQGVPPARECRLEVAVGVRVHGHRPSRHAALPLRAGARDPARRRNAARRRPERPPRLRLGAGERAERAGLPREDGRAPAAPGIGVRERVRAGRRLAVRRLRRAR